MIGNAEDRFQSLSQNGQRPSFETQRHQHNAQHRKGHYEEADHGKRQAIGQNAVGRQSAEMIGGGNGGEAAGDQGGEDCGQNDLVELARIVNFPAFNPVFLLRFGPVPVFKKSRKAHDRHEGHLETCLNGRLRLQDENEQGGERQVAKRNGGPVHDDCQEDNGEHDVRALGCGPGTGQQHIGKAKDKGCRCRPLLDGPVLGNRRGQRQQGSDKPEHATRGQ